MLRKHFFFRYFIVVIFSVSIYGCHQPNEIRIDSFPENELFQFYNGEIKLSNEEVGKLCEEIIKENSDNYLMALAYYQTGYLQRKNNENFDAFESYDSAWFYLQNTTYTDSYLASIVFQNQGAILMHHGLIEEALKKYERALPYAEDYSIKRKLIIMHNLGQALVYLDPEKAFNTFMDIIEMAEAEGLNDRMSKAYVEIGQMHIISQDYETAQKYFNTSLETAQSDMARALALHNLSQVYFYSGDYSQQEALLLQALELSPDRFITLVDLGECYMKQKRNEKALEILTKAEGLYENQLLSIDNTDLYELLGLLEADAEKHWKVRGDELKKIAIEKENLEARSKKQAMKHFLENRVMKIESQSKESKLNFYIILSILVGGIALAVHLTWRNWWVKLKRSIEEDVKDTIGRTFL